MSQEHIELFAALAAPFAEEELRVRSQSGREFQYVTARTVMNRLDEVLGPANWWDEYTPIDNAVVCRLTVRLPDGETLTKSDAGGFTTTVDASDYEKSGFSDAFKRAAVKFGVGRYLYGDGIPPSLREALVNEARPERVVEPAREREAEPAREREVEPARPAPGLTPTGGGSAKSAAAPKTGKALFAWIKERDEKLGADLLRSVSDWGKSQDFPPRMVQWSGEQVEAGHTEALRLLTSLNLDPAVSGSSNGARRR